MFYLYNYSKQKVSWEKWKLLEKIDLKGYINGVTFLHNYFEEVYGTVPQIRRYEMSIKINDVWYSEMTVAFDNGHELILTS